jgi:8-oxo-dGTP pyrophosphatase MutT (NUDIX family)
VISIRKLRRRVEAFDPRGDGIGIRARRRTLRLLEQEEDALDRHNYSPGHITASGVVFSPDGSAVLLVFHRRLQRWLQPGGHIDRDDRGPEEAAAREVLEETGVWVEDGADRLIAINVHEIPPAKGEPAHLHHDLVWRFVAADGRRAKPRERRQAVWCPVDGLTDHGADQPLLRAVRRALRQRQA